MVLVEGFRTVGYNIDDITDLVLLEVGGERDLEAGSYQLCVLRGAGEFLTIPFFLKSLEKLHTRQSPLPHASSRFSLLTHSAYPRGDRLRDPL
jgi:hypothetical protein